MPERPVDRSDNDQLTGRVRRYARVGASIGGLAAKVAGERYLGLFAGWGEMTL